MSATITVEDLTTSGEINNALINTISTGPLKAEGFDNAIVGVDYYEERLVYDADRCIEILQEDGMSYEEALEYFDFNVVQAYVGPNTPIFINQNFSEDYLTE